MTSGQVDSLLVIGLVSNVKSMQQLLDVSNVKSMQQLLDVSACVKWSKAAVGGLVTCCTSRQ